MPGSIKQDGMVLLISGYAVSGTTAACYLYNPNTNIWTTSAPLPASRYGHSCSLMLDGKVVVMGGNGATGTTTTVYVYDPVSDSWATVAALPASKAYKPQCALLDGRILVIGVGSGATLSTTCYIYDPTANTYTSAASIINPIRSMTAVTLEDGRVLLSGGLLTGANTSSTSNCYIYNPNTDNWTITTNLNTGRAQHTSVRLLDGRVLAIGGVTLGVQTSTSEIYY